MMSVAFLAGQLGRGGAERQLLYMLSALRETDVHPRVLCLTKGEPLETEIDELGVPVTWVGRSESRLARVRAITAALGSDTPDIVQSAHFFTNMYAAMAGAAVGRPSIGAVRNDVDIEVRQAGAFGRTQLFLPRFLIANSSLGRDRAIRKGRMAERVFLVRNAVETERFEVPDRSIEVDGQRPRRVLFVGNMYPRKRPDRFLRLLKGLDQSTPSVDFEARLVGSGPELSRMREIATSLDLHRGTVRFDSESPDATQFYRWADLLVLTSDHEGTPNVILEAMAAGVPVVATTVGGVPDLLTHGGGLLVRPDDEARLLRAVLGLLTDGRLRESLVRDGLRFLKANHSLAGLRNQLLSVYSTVLETSGWGPRR
jgi:glycosyltransferase involved in cell wall biosynthesis